MSNILSKKSWLLTQVAVILIIVIAILWAAAASSHESRYTAYVTAVYDGDSVTLDRQLKGPIGNRNDGLWEHNIKTRLLHINAPEMRGGTEESKAAARASRDYLSDIVLNKTVGIVTHEDEEDLYGRLLIEIWVEGVHINQLMVEKGHATSKHYRLRLPRPKEQWWED